MFTVRGFEKTFQFLFQFDFRESHVYMLETEKLHVSVFKFFSLFTDLKTKFIVAY